MRYDVFFSISQTPVAGYLPSEREMFENFFRQVKLADALGFETAWIAESHLSSQVQKQTSQPVVPHWEGEIGLNVDLVQIAHHVFACTERIEVGSAVMNILCNGGPIAAAERVAYALTLHGLRPEEQRRLHVGFAAGRFDFMNRASGILPRSKVEEVGWKTVKGKIFAEASEIFLRLLNGEILRSDDVTEPVLTRADFRSDADWAKVVEAYGQSVQSIPLPRRWTFQALKVVPQDWRRELLALIIGSHDPELQVAVNRWLPVKVFNLSITPPDQIEAVHQRMAQGFHPDGGPWQRDHMPRTVFVFINEQPELSPEGRRQQAREEAKAALGAYWQALEGTLDPAKVDRATDNALVGDAEEVAAQIQARFHPDDRLMLWFDFFNHDCDRVMQNMQAFWEQVVPRVEASR